METIIFSFNHKTVFLIIYSWQSHVGPEADVLGLNKLWVVNKISLKLQVSQLKKKVFPQQAMWARSSVPCGRRPTPPSCRWLRRGGLQRPCQPAPHTWSWKKNSIRTTIFDQTLEAVRIVLENSCQTLSEMCVSKRLCLSIPFPDVYSRKLFLQNNQIS